jgi:general secretion pathway protein J
LIRLFQRGRNRKKKIGSGFTLLELLLAMTIFSVIIVLVLSMLRIGVLAWKKGEGELELLHRQRIVHDLIKHQLSSIKKPGSLKEKNGKKIIFHGNEDSIAFISNYSISSTNQYKDVLVKYYVEQDDDGAKLFCLESEYSRFNISELKNFEKESDEYRLLMGNADKIEFEYIKLDSEKNIKQWMSVWNIDKEKSYPTAVRLNIEYSEFGGESFRIMGRLIGAAIE